jgi:Arc/MetJ family transcription regulator
LGEPLSAGPDAGSLNTHKSWNYTHHGEVEMRTNIEIDDKLIREAMRRSGAPTKKAAVEAGLRLLVKTFAQTDLRKLRGAIDWTGDLNEMRRGRTRA